MVELKVHRVVAAVIEREGRYLITQRMPKAVFPLYWEFPGGKVEPGEDDRTALKRELREELDVDVEVGELFEHRIHEYEWFTVDFCVYRCKLLSDDIKAVNVADFKWVTLQELSDYKFPPADESAVAKLLGIRGVM